MKKIVLCLILASYLLSAVSCAFLFGNAKCPSCDAKYDKGDAFCKECGASLEQKCPSCDKEYKDGDAFCSNCGYSLDKKDKNDDENDDEGKNDIEDTDGEKNNAVSGTLPTDEQTSDNGSSPSTSDQAQTPVEQEKHPSEIWLLMKSTVDKNSVMKYEYDYDGNKTVCEFVPYGDENTVLIRWTYTYGIDGNLKAYKTENYMYGTSSAGTYGIKTVETPKGTKVSEEITYDNTGKESSKKVFIYNDQGDLVEMKEYSGSVLSSRSEYDAKTGNVLKDFDESNKLSREYFYNEDGYCYEEKVYQDGIYAHHQVHTLDSHGNPIRTVNTNISTNSKTETVNVYKSLERYRIENGH